MNWTQRRKQQARWRRARQTGIGLLAALTGLIITGLILPAEHVRSARAVLDRSPEVIWRVLTDVDGMPLWRSDLAAVERLPDLAGRPTWLEIGRRGTRVIEVSRGEPPRRLLVQRARAGQPGNPARLYELEPAPGGTLLTITERVETRNPLGRVLVRIGVVRPAIQRLLGDLALRLSISRRQVAVRE